MDRCFSIPAWSAFAPGLESPQDWLDWSRAPSCPQGEAVPALVEMPAMQRRRLEPLGRLALQVAWRCQPVPEPDLPLVFASRHGDIRRTFDMLEGLAAGEPLSPTHFGLSTHNAIGASYSIARGLRGNHTAVSAGTGTVEAGVAEALGLLADGAPAVLLVAYDGPTPDAYARYQDEPGCPWAWAWRIEPVRPGQPAWSITPAQAPPAPGPHSLPHGLDVLRHWLDASPHWPSRDGRWHWRRRG